MVSSSVSPNIPKGGFPAVHSWLFSELSLADRHPPSSAQASGSSVTCCSSWAREQAQPLAVCFRAREASSCRFRGLGTDGCCCLPVSTQRRETGGSRASLRDPGTCAKEGKKVSTSRNSGANAMAILSRRGLNHCLKHICLMNCYHCLHCDC